MNDDTKIIQQGIDSAKIIEGILFFPYTDASYLITSTLILENGNNVWIKGDSIRGTRIALQGEPFKGILVRKSRNISISHLVIIGQNIKKLGVDAAGIKISLSDSVNIFNVTVKQTTTNGIEGILSNYCVVSQCTVMQTKNYNGIGWAGGHNNLFENNYCAYNRGQGIEIRSQQNTIVRNNYCAFNGERGEQSSGITVEAEDGYIEAKRIDIGSYVTIYAKTHHGYKSGNLIRIPVKLMGKNQIVALPVISADEYSIQIDKNENDILIKPGDKILYAGSNIEVAYPSENILVEGNICENNNGYGIYIVSDKMARVRNVTLKQNKIIDNVSCGILVASGVGVQEYRTTSNIFISNNQLHRNGVTMKQWGIWIYFADSISIKNNTLTGNGNEDRIQNAGGILITRD